MSYNNENNYRLALEVIECHNEHYKDGVTTYIGVWREFIYPRFFISYKTYKNILEMPGIKEKLKKEIAKKKGGKNGKKL